MPSKSRRAPSWLFAQKADDPHAKFAQLSIALLNTSRKESATEQGASCPHDNGGRCGP